MFVPSARAFNRALVLLAPSLGLLSACKPDSGLTKFNSNPEAEITAPSDGATVLSGTVATLRGAASDPNHRTTELSARWFVDDAEVCAAATPAEDGTTTCDVTIPDATSMSVRLEVIDPEGSAGTDEVALVVTPNADPVATIQSPTADGVYYSDQLVTFRGAVSDVEDDASTLTVWWEDGATRLDAVEATPTGSGEVLGYATLAEGPHALELHALDSAGNEAIATVLVDVGPPNSAPACAITEPADGSSGESGASVTFRGAVSDVDIPADLLSVTWTSDKDGLLGASTPTSGGSVTFPYAALSVDTHVVSMQVVDEVGATCTAEVLYTVGSPPEIDIENPISGDVVNEGDTVTFTALVSDGEDVPGDLWVTWESDVDGILYEGPPDSSGLAEVLDDTLTRGDHVVTATVTDTAGLYATARVTLNVNGVPSAPGITLSPASPDTDDDLRVSIGTASVDPDGDPVTYAYAWSLDGVASSASTSATLPASATTRGDVWSVAVTATDGLGTSAAGTASVTIANTAPVLASLTLSPDPATEDDVLVCTAGTATDDDGDAVGIVYDWRVNGVALGYDSDTLDGAYFDRGDTVVCTATPTDGTDDGTTRTSNTLTIENSAPSVATVSITPSSATASSTLTCAYSGYDDADGDADQSTYSWTVDGVEVGTGRTLSGSFVGGDVVTCTVTPDDGTDVGAAVAASVTIANTAPVLASASLTPNPAYEADALRCAPGAVTDSDGTTSFTYSYGWLVNGSAVVATASTLTGASFAAGDAVACVVSASDGTSTSAAVTSNTVTIANTAPVLASVSVSPTSATELDTLTCVTGATSDADGDSVEVLYAWFVDGAEVAGATESMLDGADFDRDQSVWCTATPFDGASAGLTRTAGEITIDNTAPSLASVSITPASASASSTLTCSYAGYDDPDADPEGVSYAWTVDGVTVGTSRTLSGEFVGGDVVTCTVTPDDGTDVGAAVAASVTIANTAPVLASASLTPDPAYEADTLRCAPGTATDSDGTTSFTYGYGWLVNGSAIAATGSTLTGGSFAAGDEVACAVTASDGTSTSAAVTSNTVTIANTAPVMASVSVSPSSGRVGDTLSCAASASDADGGVTYSYAWSNGATGASYTIAASDNPGDALTCTGTATDSAGATATGTASATVLNTAPVVATVSVTPSTGRVGDVLTCAATATDADGGTPSVAYAWSNGATGASVTLSASDDPGDVLTCTATATDTDGGSGSGSASGTVLNTSPVLGTVSITPASAYNDDLLSCSASATDADGGTPSLSYAWTNTTRGTSLGSSATLSLTSAVAGSRDAIACAVTASDADGGTVSANASVTLANRAPVVLATLTPSIPTARSTLSCAGSATDADGDSTSLTFSWTVDGAPVTATSTYSTLSTLASVFAAGQLVACTVTATDGKTGTDSDSASVTIDNTAPVVSGVTLSPSTVYTNDTLTATASGSDADGDTLSWTYDWYVDGDVVQSSASNTLSGASYFDRDEGVYVVARADDGVDTASATSASITVSNTAPTAPVVEITPSDAAGGDDLTCDVVTESTDADGDPVTYTFAWDADGVAYTDAVDSATSSFVDGADVGGGETWTCEVEAGDGDAVAVGIDTLDVVRACDSGRIALSASGVDFVAVCAQTFDMGCTPGQSSCASNTMPVMPVTLTRDYYVSQTEITQGQYRTVMGSNPSFFSSCGSDCPVEYVTWHMAAAFANAVSTAEGLPQCYTCSGSGSSVSCAVASDPYTCDGYRLLTEAEWEGAARCGDDLLYAGSNNVGDVAWHSGNSSARTHAVAGLAANACGLYDMSGNVWEWTQDWYSETYYSRSGRTDPTGAGVGPADKVLRGGAFNYGTTFARVSQRAIDVPAVATAHTGFRLARTVP